MEKNSPLQGAAVPKNQEQNMSAEAKCPVTRRRSQTHVAGAPTNAGWWPNQLNLKILHQHSSLSDPMDKEFNYARGIQEPRPGCRDQGPPCLDDRRRRTGGRPTMATMGRFSFVWRGTAQVRTASATAAAAAASGTQRFAPLNSWPDNVEPRQGAPVALADQAEVWPENLLGRPDDSRR